MLDPRNGEVLSLVSLPAYDPNEFAVGIDRATWASLNTDKLKPLQNRALQGTLLARVDVQDRGGDRRPGGRRRHAGLPRHCAGGASFYGRYFQCQLKGGHGTRRHAPRDRAVLQRLLLHARQHARRRPDPQVGDGARPRRQDRHRPAERGAGLVPSTEWKRRDTKREVVPG